GACSGGRRRCVRRWIPRCTPLIGQSTWRSRARRSAKPIARPPIHRAGKAAIRKRVSPRGYRPAPPATCAWMHCMRGWRHCADACGGANRVKSGPRHRGFSDMRTACLRLSRCLLPLLLLAAAPAMAQTSPETPDIPSAFVAPTAGYDYERREAMIPMRDGVELHTVIIVPRGAKDAPIVLSRTPYNADSRTTRMASPNMIDVLPENDEVFVRGGYIRVVQDVRGKR